LDLPQAGLSLEAPETLGAPRLRGDRYIIGAFPKDPVQVVVSWTESSEAVQDPSHQAEALAASLNETIPEGTPQGPALPTLLEGRPAAHRSYAFRTGGSLVVWLTLEEKVLARLHVIVLPQADTRWSEIGDHLARSLKPSP
jgi:hypothetical protein